MDNAKRIAWFLKELPHLLGEGVIDKETSEKLKAYYSVKMTSNPLPGYFTLILGVLGVLLVIIGAAILVGKNWGEMPHGGKLVISFIPLLMSTVFSSFVLLLRRRQVWREFAALATCASIFTLFFLLQDIYYFSEPYFYAYLIASLIPFIYIFNSISLVTVYIFGLFPMLSMFGDMPLLLLGGVIAVVPYIRYHLQPQARMCVMVRYLTMPLALFLLFSIRCCALIWALPLFVFANVFLLAGWEYHHKNESIWRNPWLTCAFLVLLVVLYYASCFDSFWAWTFKPSQLNKICFWSSVGIMTAVSVALYLRRALDLKRFMFAVLLGLGVAGFFVPHATMCLITCVYIVIFGLALLLDGGRRQKALTFNGGLLMFVVLIVGKVFNSHFGVIGTSIGLCLLGIGIVIANIFFAKRAKIGD